MPTALPSRSGVAAAAKRLSWPDTARFLILLVRVRRLNRRLEIGRRRVERDGLDVAGPDLLLTSRRWLATHEAIAGLLGVPEQPHVAQVRATLQPLDRVRRRATAAPHRVQDRPSQG